MVGFLQICGAKVVLLRTGVASRFCRDVVQYLQVLALVELFLCKTCLPSVGEGEEVGGFPTHVVEFLPLQHGFWSTSVLNLCKRLVQQALCWWFGGGVFQTYPLSN